MSYPAGPYRRSIPASSGSRRHELAGTCNPNCNTPTPRRHYFGGEQGGAGLADAYRHLQRGRRSGSSYFSELGLATSGDVSILQGQINSLARRDDKLAEGIAASVALAQPILRSGQHFGMTAGWGGYDSANAVGFSAAGVLADNYFVPAAVPLAVYGGIGVGTSEGEAAGRAGMSFGW